MADLDGKDVITHISMQSTSDAMYNKNERAMKETVRCAIDYRQMKDTDDAIPRSQI